MSNKTLQNNNVEASNNGKTCEICEKPHNNNYLCTFHEILRGEEIINITLKDMMKEFKDESRKFKKYLKQDFTEIKRDYPFDSFHDETFEDFIQNTINATYDLENEDEE